ncbi:MAG: hypothetical protein ACFFDM_09525 [Candidatus Thorarchaeota archaeon]
MSEDNSDRVIVSQGNLARCKWCGTPESPYWTITKTEELFCSYECMLASVSLSRRVAGILIILMGFFFFLPFILFMIQTPFPINSGGLIPISFLGIIFMFVGAFFFAEGKEGLLYKDRKGKYRGVSPIECTYCSHQNSPQYMTCQNCGAPLSGAPFTRVTTPPWFHIGFSKGVYKCPHCTAIYSYRQAPRSQDGLVTCQNCLRPFLPVKASRVDPQSRHFY